MIKPTVVGLLLWLNSGSVGATYFSYNHDMLCRGVDTSSEPVSVSIQSVTCNGEAYCTFGETARVYGSVTLNADLPQADLCWNATACFLGLYPCKSYSGIADVCTDFGVSASDSSVACPSAGSFYFEKDVVIPGSSSYSLGSGKFIDGSVGRARRLNCGVG
jgi:hypothetical protein